VTAPLVDHDLHVHTHLSSCCYDASSTPANLVARAAAAGLRTLGIADHTWDVRVPGASHWYRSQTAERLEQTRRQLPADTQGVRVLVGCETEYCGDGLVGITRETAATLDYVLVPASHFHMEGLVRPAGLDAPADVARLLVERFDEAAALDVVTGVAHPFLPLGFEDDTDEIIAIIPDAQFAESFGRAAERGVSIEVTLGFFPQLREWEPANFHDETFLRVLTLAREAGCLFHFASDSHRLAGVGACRALEPYARQIGITPQHIHPLARYDG